MTTNLIDQAEEAHSPQCRHHWVIDSPNGAVSLGRCKRCNEVREFRNSAADTIWEGDPMASASRMGGGGRTVAQRPSRGASED